MDQYADFKKTEKAFHYRAQDKLQLSSKTGIKTGNELRTKS